MCEAGQSSERAVKLSFPARADKGFRTGVELEWS